jgi:parvulin-like peptidyl-prolyl isomerase
LVLFGLSLLATSVFAQSEPDAAILKVNGQEVFQSDLELVKSMLPLERYKTTKARTNLIEGIYLEFLIQKTVLEQKGMQKVTPKLIEDFLAQPASIDLYSQTRSKEYTPEGLAARRLLERAYINAYQSAWFEEYTQAVINPKPDVKAALERQITSSYLEPDTVLEVKVRAMLLRDETTAKRLEKQIRSDSDFERLARQYSLVRASVGGSYPGTERPESTKLNYLEPELQVAISTFAKTGIFRMNAPFGRMWLVNLLDVSKLRRNLINTTPVTAELSFGGITRALRGSYLGDGSQLNGLSGLKPSDSS